MYCSHLRSTTVGILSPSSEVHSTLLGAAAAAASPFRNVGGLQVGFPRGHPGGVRATSRVSLATAKDGRWRHVLRLASSKNERESNPLLGALMSGGLRHRGSTMADSRCGKTSKHFAPSDNRWGCTSGVEPAWAQITTSKSPAAPCAWDLNPARPPAHHRPSATIGVSENAIVCVNVIRRRTAVGAPKP